ncbi:MAG TPA: PRC-barrel domain-containing protein [Methanotrichaceae archaeon]|nr:PRC-barrel domain-containing protein [Methanotrichaceae archaeon]
MRTEITSLLGLDVYTQRGVFVGRVDDAVLDTESGIISGLALGSLNKSLLDQKSKGIVVPFSMVTAVGDIVLVRHIVKHAKNNRKDS